MKALRALEEKRREANESNGNSQYHQKEKPLLPKRLSKMAREKFGLGKSEKEKHKDNLHYTTETHNRNLPEQNTKTSHINQGYSSYLDNLVLGLNEDDHTQGIYALSLQDLVQQQDGELQQLEDEFDIWREGWVKRVQATKIRHKQERRQLIQSTRRVTFPGESHFPNSVLPAGYVTTETSSQSIATVYRPYHSQSVNLNDLTMQQIHRNTLPRRYPDSDLPIMQL